MKMKKNMNGVTRIHNVRFYNLSPRAINCICYSKTLCKLALSRNDGSIEIWDIAYAPFLEKTIPGELNSSTDAIAWANERLFTGGLAGEICEWDLCHLKKKNTKLVTGTAIWCMDIDQMDNFLVLGTEDGYVNIYDISEGDLNFKTIFDKQEGRIMCCKYNDTGEFIVTGSSDAIRIWDTKTGHAIRRISVGRSEAKRETIVWSLQVLKDLIVISGDSRGCVTVWDGKLGTQIESHQVLKADVLAVTVNEDEDIFCCAGIEPLIRIYALTAIKKEDHVVKKWVKFIQKKVHEHDVRALVCANMKIYSGGIDGYLGISSYSKEKFHQEIIKHGPFLQSPCAYVAQEVRLILLRYVNFLEIWKLGSAEDKVQISDEDDVQGKIKEKFLLLQQGPEKLLEFRSRNDEHIIAAAISPDGRWLVYSTMNSIRIFSIDQDANAPKLKLQRIKDVPEQFRSSNHIIFSSDSKTLFLVKSPQNRIDIFNILSTDVDYAGTIDTSKAIKDHIHLVQISNCGGYFVVAGTCKTIAIWKKIKRQWKHHLNLPKYMAATTAIAIHKQLPRLVVSFTDGKIFEYDIEEMRFTCSSYGHFLSESQLQCVKNIVLDPRNENVIILHNDSKLFVLDKKNTKEDDENVNKIAKIESVDDDDGAEEQKIPQLKITFTKSYEHFVHLTWLSDTELVVIGVNPVALIEQLPGALRQKKFGES